MSRTTRRTFVRAGLGAVAGSGLLAMLPGRAMAEAQRPAPRVRPNILYALSTGSWGRVVASGSPLALLQVLDETAAAGFNGVRLTGYPAILEQNRLSVEQLGAELERRGLKFSTVSFGGEYYKRDRQPEIRERAVQAWPPINGSARRRWFFPGSPVPAADEAEALRESFRFFNELGKMALEQYGVRIGLHNHTDSMIENPTQVDRFLEGTDPRWVYCAWDTAHLHLGGCDVQAVFRKSIDRIVYTDFKDATRSPARARLRGSQRGALRRGLAPGPVLQLDAGVGARRNRLRGLDADAGRAKYRGWINHDLDTIRISTADSWRVSMNYITTVLDPIYE